MSDFDDGWKPQAYSKEYKLTLFRFDIEAMHRCMSSYVTGTPTHKMRYLIEDTDYYRVDIKPDFVEVVSLILDEVDDTISGLYDELSDLPVWMQERIAVLSMLSYKPPTGVIEGVGRRISEFTYWVEKPDSCV